MRYRHGNFCVSRAAFDWRKVLERCWSKLWLRRRVGMHFLLDLLKVTLPETNIAPENGGFQ